MKIYLIPYSHEDEYDADDEEVVFVFKFLGEGAEGSAKYSYREK
jgi:hypothetical protein